MFIPSAIKSIQYGTCTFAGVSLTADATLSTAIVVANSIVIPLGSVSPTVNNYINGVDYYYLKIQGTTTVRATVCAANPGAFQKFMVVEFFGYFVKTSAQGTIAMGNTVSTGTASFSPNVNVDKTMLVMTGWNFTNSAAVIFDGASAYTNSILSPYLERTSTSTITAYLQYDVNNANIYTRVIGYNYLEFR